MNEKKVGIGEVKIEQGEVRLSAFGVGSCIVIMLYDETRKIGGLAHCLLPFGGDSSLKYPRNAIAEMLKQMSQIGASRDNIVAKIVGGATMFESFERHAIGKRNVVKTREELNKLDIPIIAEDVFGNWGRSISFNLTSGEVKVRSYRHGEKIL
ncbi:MAG: chemotaxis protein CheD [bacterium]